ncbi:centromere protein Chl4/mis15/CENP-N [Corynascus novoguineensis]|uniref:Centromere protein Chl4/mis15/CENP-N n=1 Tax=Corynascus novoguineensis TaxID=1126955 RepID=A0AAN7CVE6_9PEZI|nr:centromere protein Chl4/mis15/CENP-N [Corynascus novoguineensis]
MARISVPTTARLPSSLRVDPTNPAATKILSRLSRSSLISVALDWLDEINLPQASPYLRQDEDEDEDEDEVDDFYPPARSLEELRDIYTSLQARKGSKREVLERITEGDWRHGLTLYQLAMADLQYLYDHPTSQKWSAYRIMPLKPPRDPDGEEPPEIDRQSLTIPRFHPSTFLKTLQSQVLPDVKAHYNFDAHKSLPLLILRIFILDSPYNTNHAMQQSTTSTTAFDSSRTVYIAFPDASPHVFISKPQTTTTVNNPGSNSNPRTGDGRRGGGEGVGVGVGVGGEARSLRNLLVEGIPKALSRPLRRQRFALQSTSLVTRNLAELVHRRGGGRANSAGAGWSVYYRTDDDDSRKTRETPLDLVLPSPPLSEQETQSPAVAGTGGGKRSAPLPVVASAEERREERAAKRARLVARARFAGTAVMGDGKGVERVDVVIEDPFPEVGEQHQDEDGLDKENTVERVEATGRKGRRRKKSRVDEASRGAAEDEDGDVRSEERGEEGAQGWRPYVRLTFHGSHVFAGIRQLVESGIIDGERMPGWMTGEEGVTIGAVRNGRIRGHKGSGV